MRSSSRSWNSASLALVLNLCLSSTAALAGDVANQVSLPVPSTIHSFWPSAVCNSAALGCLGPVLVYDNNSTHQLATRALDWCGIPYTKAVAADFVTLLSGGGWDVVLMDLPSSEPSDTAWPDALPSHITAGGKAIHTHYPLELGLAHAGAAGGLRDNGRSQPRNFDFLRVGRSP